MLEQPVARYPCVHLHYLWQSVRGGGGGTEKKNIYLIFSTYQNYPLVLKCKKPNTNEMGFFFFFFFLMLSNHFSASVLSY